MMREWDLEPRERGLRLRVCEWGTEPPGPGTFARSPASVAGSSASAAQLRATRPSESGGGGLEPAGPPGPAPVGRSAASVAGSSASAAQLRATRPSGSGGGGLEPAGPPGPAGATVILHGYLEQGAAWDAVATRLRGRVLAPDHRGHGLSEHVGRGGFYHFWDYVSDLDALVDAIGGPVDLVGHSMGGTVAGLFAGTCPDKVRRLVLVEGLGPPDAQAVAVDRAREFLTHRRALPFHPVLRDVAEGVERMRRFNPELPEATARRLVERTTRPVDGGLVWTWDPLHRARSPQPFVAGLFERFLRQIRAPTLLVRGGRSPWVLPDHGEREACLHDARSIEIAGAGHLVHHDAPELLAAAIRDHLDGSAPNGTAG